MKLVAQQLTLLDHQLLKRIKDKELLHKNFLDPKKAPTFNLVVAQANKVGSDFLVPFTN